ncbi:MAG TPA: transcription antitermination factor NusB [Terriglobales bacterium]|nr:transcription antitermination factor NusB [Terriglobales bacterium]
MSPARQLARDVLLAVEERGGYASDLLHSPLARGLSPADLRLATEIVMGVLRWRAQLDFVLERAARRPVARMQPAARVALRIGAYQLRFLSRIPASAAVNESVALAKASDPRLGGFVNAVLRHLPAEPVEALLAPESDLRRRREVEFSHPAWLLERWSRAYSPATADRIAEFNNQPPPTAFRLAPGAALPTGLAATPGLLLASALRATSGDLTHTPAFRAHQLWIQDEASQLIPYLLEPQSRDRILDACAAPGAKTALLQALAPAATLVALERHLHRARLLRRLLPSLPLLLVADASRPLPLRGQFDRILVDAPCTGTGTLARNPEIRWRLDPADPARLAQLQLAILRQALARLRPAGRCVYSVCSIESEEGPGVVAAVLAADSSLSLLPAANVLASLAAAHHLAPGLDPASLTAGAFLRILPGQHATDGFFAAILQRH